LRQRMGRAATAHAHETFGADRLVADHARIYESIAAKKGF
jgi:hypothetical protein